MICFFKKIGFLVISLVSTTSLAQKNCSVLLSFSFKDVVELDENDVYTKTFVYADTSLVYESQPFMLSEPMLVDFQVTQGTHEFKVVHFVERNGIWEELKLTNEFVFEGRFVQTIQFRKKIKIDLFFVPNTEKPIFKIK
jgi:hypothetical protein